MFFTRKHTRIEDDQMRQLLHGFEALEERLGNILQKLTQQDQRVGNEQQTLSGAQADLLSRMESVNRSLTELQETVVKQSQPQSVSVPLPQAQPETNGMADVVKDYSQRIQRYETDLYHKILSPILREIIRVTDRLEELEKKEDLGATAAEVIRREREALVGILHNHNVDRFRSEPDTEFNPEMQEAAGTRPTNDPALAGTVAESVRAGYIWTLPFVSKGVPNPGMPEKISIIMREERVILHVNREV